jgi:hypothetical protein
MSFTRCCRLAPLFLASLNLNLPLNLPAQTPPQPAEAPPPSHATYPQIVRLSLVEGDVRIARGNQDEKLTGNAWEQATAGIPLESGFSLATGPDGRAEIEFEDTSTLYVAPNSALSLADLTTKDGVPQTRLSLLSGTVTTHFYPTIPGERFLLETATHALDIRYGDTSYLRITSFLDAMQFTPMDNHKIAINHTDLQTIPGHTYSLIGLSTARKSTPSTTEQLAWDNWVSERVKTRDATMQSVMHEANLTSPIPGLADLADKGTFTPCAPYGTCWVPTNGWTQQSPDTTPAAKPSPQQSSDSTPIKPSPEAQRYIVSVAQLRQSGSQTPPTHGVAPALLSYDDFDDFPCDPWRLWYNRTLFAYPDNLYPYDWAVCHAGFWIYRQNRYMWVAGTHNHHHCPVHWVKYQGKLGYVPMHPRDRHGLPPVNLRHGLYQRTDKPAHPVERVALDGKSSPKVLDSTPKEFRTPAPTQLARADAPQVAVHMMHEGPRTGANGVASPRAVSSSLTFDQHSNRFMLATRVTDGGHTHTFTEPMSDRGGHINPGTGGGFRGGAAGGAGFSHAGGYSGGGGGGHYSGGGGSSGGGHSGGGGFSGGGGGGSHSGGGGSSGGGASSGGGGASAGGGSGGGHH